MEDISSGTIEEEWTYNQERKVIKRELFRMAMEGKWDEVAELYEQDEWAQTAKITNSGDTALHIAVSVGKEDNVRQLIQSIWDPSRLRQVLETRNDRGNTPLHSAASMGNVAMCQCIATVYPELVVATNNNQETPLFMAALHGEKAAFFYLHYVCINAKMDGYQFPRRKNGDTILHCAIAGDYFDLAFHIIKFYPELASLVNEEGLTPLHLLASNPSAFRSGSHLAGYYKIIYYCILVDQLEEETFDYQPERTDEKNLNPETYRACNDLLQLFWRMVLGVTGKNRNGEETEKKTERKGREKTDAENPEPNAGSPGIGVEKNFWLEPYGNQLMRTRDSPGKKKTPAYPENYRTCNDFFKLLWKMVLVVAGINRGKTDAENTEVPKARRHGTGEVFPANYSTCIEFVKLANKAMLMFLGLGITTITKIKSNKQKHTWAVQILNELLALHSTYEDTSTSGDRPREPAQSRTKELEETRPYDLDEPSSVIPSTDSIKASEIDGMEKTLKMAKMILLIDSKSGINDIVKKVQQLFPISIQDRNAENKNLMMLVDQPQDKPPEMPEKETPILLAAKNGITEIVERILDVCPIAINDLNADNKNIVLLAVEYRQPKVYELLRRRNISKESMFRQLDKEENSALHLAAKLGDKQPWRIPGEALQMQWENKWYEYVRDSMPHNFFPRYNKEGKTPGDLFTETHKDLVENGSKWLTNTSQSCSVVAALIATVAFTASTTVPGGFESTGIPALENKPGFDLFVVSSLVALCFSITALVMFLAILTSRYQERDFGSNLPRKLLMGLSSLFVSIAAMLISFCGGHFFVLKEELKFAAIPVYAVTCLPVTFFAVAQFPLYIDLLRSTLSKVPQRSHKVDP
ncbi:hypothetical protein F2P56_024608 [Juglans regia]|uniref:Uncharacterized protein LOC109018651 isoform X1 n=2 Tax=Juglans regia TaxID=51240 RepID=A0A2I4HJJ1_JUGRE|nr:uncharacterized protein LOC109018651 isoform X1 [Juglans regia]KAF5454986.1 hypothetical protein F2P56_024608 [Juglans regia]